MTRAENEYNVGVVGATGLVGKEFLKILETRENSDFKVGSLRLFASARSAGREIEFSGKKYIVEEAFPHPDMFENLDFVLTAVGDEQAKLYSPAVSQKGALNVDKSNAWRMDPVVPLVVPEVNPEDAKENKGIIAGPNCSTIQMVVALWPIHKENPIERITVSTYQAVSGSGQGGVSELLNQQNALADNTEPEVTEYPHQISGNLFPEIGGLKEDGYFSEEMKMVNETRKIFHEPELPINATCVRVPVVKGHSEAVNIELKYAMDPAEAIEILLHAPGVKVESDPKKYVTPLEASEKDDVFVGRIRKDLSHQRGLSMWVVSDNLRKGAALNAVQVFELVARNNWQKGS